MQNSHETWQVETQGQIYEAEFEELKQWITEGAVVASDKVKRGKLRWLPVEKVPEFSDLFSSNDAEQIFSDFTAADDLAGKGDIDNVQAEPEQLTEAEAVWEITGEKVCYVHKHSEAVYACAICRELFCKICPGSYGGNVKLCPICGSLCISANGSLDARQQIGAVNKPYFKTDEIINDSAERIRFSSRFADLQKLSSAIFEQGKEVGSKLIASVFSRPSKL